MPFFVPCLRRPYLISSQDTPSLVQSPTQYRMYLAPPLHKQPTSVLIVCIFGRNLCSAQYSHHLLPGATSGAGDGFRPSRRVRTTPGGAHTNIFGHEDDDDALANAPPRQDSTEVCFRYVLPNCKVLPPTNKTDTFRGCGRYQ